MKRNFKKLAEYTANFLSNLAVAGLAVAIFRADEALAAILASFVAYLTGALIVHFIAGDKS